MSKRMFFVFLALCLTVGWLRGSAAAQTSAPPPDLGPGWHLITAQPVTPDAARAALAEEATTARAAQMAVGLPPSETEATPEIQALSRALHNDPKLIFDYVHNRIETITTYGSINGAHATLLAGRGNDWDQASLLIALMRAAGYTASYGMGDVTYPVSRLANWLGVANEINAVGNALANGGVPVASGSGGLVVSRVWAEVEIGGSTYIFDPAMKIYAEENGIDVAGASEYNRADLLAHAGDGATVSADAVQNLNEGRLRTDLTAYSMNLVSYIEANMPTASLAQVIGGRQIAPREMETYVTELPEAMSVANRTTFAAIPQANRHTLRVEHAGMDFTFATHAIAARRLTLFYTHDTAQPVLYVDGSPIITGTATRLGSSYPMTITVDHKYAEAGWGDQMGVIWVQSGGSYAFIHDFSTVSAELIVQRNRLLARYNHDGLDPRSEAVRGEALSLMGLTWTQESRLFNHLADRLGNTLSFDHHTVGVVGQEEGYYVDIPMGKSSIVPRDGTADVWPVFRTQTFMGSAFEHGILEQLQGADKPGLSAVKLLQLGNANGKRTFLAVSANWTTIKPQLQNYSATKLAFIEAGLAAGHTYVLPEDAHITLNQWQGVGYVDDFELGNAGSIGMIIGGGYKGGYGSEPGEVADGKVQDETDEGNQPADNQGQVETSEDSDPVDMTTGAFHLSTVDLAPGGDMPFGLPFVRSYSSGGNYGLGSLGYGWSHNYDQSLHRHSDGPVGLGTRQPQDAASLIVFVHTALDMLAGQRSIDEWMATDLAAKWAMDQLTENALTVHTGSRTLEYIRLADGSYQPPPGMKLALRQDGAYFYRQGAANDVTIYDAPDVNGIGPARFWRDSNGNTLTFAYDDTGRVQGVSNNVGISLTLGYTGNKLTSVTDQWGRGVVYTYTNNDLTAFQDTGGHVWGYAYDAAHRLTQTSTPAGRNHVTNVYDTLGRMLTQQDGLGNTTTFYFSGYRNGLRDPAGNLTTTFVDGQGRTTARQDAADQRFQLVYNNQGQLTQIDDREGAATRYTYHAPSGQIATLTNGLGATIRYTHTAQQLAFTNPVNSQSITFAVYAPTQIGFPDGTHEGMQYDSRGNLVTRIDRMGSQERFEYNSRGQITRHLTPLGGEAVYTYNGDGSLASARTSDEGAAVFAYDGLGRLQTITDGAGGSTHMGYDGNDRLLSVEDGNGHRYTFTYDLDGNLTQSQNAAGHAITYTVDAAGRMIQLTDPLGQTTHLTHDSLGRVVTMTDPNGESAQYGYDSRGWLTQLTDGADKIWRWTYDNEHMLRSTVTPLGNTTTFSYNAIGWLTGITDPLGQSGSTTYDELGRPMTLTDRLGRSTAFAYDANGSLISLTPPLVGTATYARNPLGLLTQLTDFRGQAWAYAYTPMGRMQSHTDPLGNTWQNSYDAARRLTQVTYPTGEVLTRTYDAAGLDTAWGFSDGTQITYTYDAVDWLVGTEGVGLTYDARGEVINTRSDGVDFAATYDAGGRLKTVGYNGGQFQVTYTYDARDLVTRVEDSLTQSWLTLAYDDDGELIQISRSNDTTTSFSRDANGRITRILTQGKGGATLADQQFTLNAEGEVTQVRQRLPLDPGSLILARRDSLTYDAASQVSSPGYAYDARGRLTQSPGHTFTWNAANRLTGVDDKSLVYNGLGDLIGLTEGGETTRFFYNYALALTPVVAEERGGQFQKFYVWAPGGALLYGIDPAQGNATFFYHFERMGSTLFLSDTGGQVTDAYAYAPYGELLGHTGSNDQPFAFVGQFGVRRIDNTLYQMGRRFYDATAGHFLSRDGQGVNVHASASLNPYQYAQQDPVNLIDPPGEGEWNADKTVFYSKTGSFVQTKAPNGNFLGGWKWVPNAKDNPPKTDAQPPNKEEKQEERPADQGQDDAQPPVEQHREAQNKAAQNSPGGQAKQSTGEISSTPPNTGPSNTATQTGPPNQKSSGGSDAKIPSILDDLDSKTGGFKRWALTVIKYYKNGKTPGGIGLNRVTGELGKLIDVEKELYGLVKNLQTQKEQTEKAGVEWKLLHPGLSETAQKLREHTERVKDTWHYRWFGF